LLADERLGLFIFPVELNPLRLTFVAAESDVSPMSLDASGTPLIAKWLSAIRTQAAQNLGHQRFLPPYLQGAQYDSVFPLRSRQPQFLQRFSVLIGRCLPSAYSSSAGCLQFAQCHPVTALGSFLRFLLQPFLRMALSDPA